MNTVCSDETSVIVPNLYLLNRHGEIYGNNGLILKKYGRLLLMWDKVVGMTCFVLNTTEQPFTLYTVHKLKEECIQKRTSCCDAFNIQDISLREEPEVSFQFDTDGSFTLRFKQPPLEIQQCHAFCTILEQEIREEAVRDNGDSGEDLVLFFDLLKYFSDKDVCSKVKIWVYTTSSKSLLKEEMKEYDVVLNIDNAGMLLKAVPPNWLVFYDVTDTSISCNPLIYNIQDRVRPLSITK